MNKLDILGDIMRALSILTRVPLRARFPEGSAARAVWAFPIAGVVVTGTAVAVASAFMGAGVAVGAVVLGLAVQTVLTGAMHEDGIADTADGLGGGWTPERRLEIMKDSHIGTYGVVALILVFLLRWSLWTTLLWLAPLTLVAAAALSRGLMPLVMALVPPARSEGMAQAVGRPVLGTVAIGLMLALAIAWVCAGIVPALLGLLTGLLATACVGLLARAKIGGQTGDILGTTQVVGEITCLLVMASWLAA